MLRMCLQTDASLSHSKGGTVGPSSSSPLEVKGTPMAVTHHLFYFLGCFFWLLRTAQSADKSQESSLSGPHLISGEMIIDQYCVDRFLITAPKSQ